MSSAVVTQIDHSSRVAKEAGRCPNKTGGGDGGNRRTFSNPPLLQPRMSRSNMPLKVKTSIPMPLRVTRVTPRDLVSIPRIPIKKVGVQAAELLVLSPRRLRLQQNQATSNTVVCVSQVLANLFSLSCSQRPGRKALCTFRFA